MRRGPALLIVSLVWATAGCADEAGDPDGAARTTTTTLAAPEEPAAVTTAAPPGEVATAAPVPSAGCGTSPTRAVALERRTLPGTDRWYLLTVPAAHDGAAPLPVVLDFHGLGEGAEVHARTSGIGPYAEAQGFVAVLPNGTGSPVRWSGALDRDANADLAFVDDLLDTLEADLCVDTSRVFATGFSNGALMSSTIACAMADRFTAVAPVAGVVRPARCEPARPVPMLGFHGTVDPILLFNGGVGSRLGRAFGGGSEEEEVPEADLDGAGYPAGAAAWAAGNGCDPDPTTSDLTPSVLERVWDCPVGGAVVFEIMVGAGHSWPGSAFTRSIEQIVGPTDMSIDGTDMIWRFFQRFALPG